MKKILSNVSNKLKEKLQTLFKKLEGAVGPFAKIAIALSVIGATVLTASLLFSDKSDITTSTVMITSLNERGGGSGVIVGVKNKKTLILTNKHICEVIETGGLVKTTAGQSHTVLSFQESELHDLCLITVAAELPGKVALASSSPTMYEHATVSGHPALLPNVVTEGHFSGNKIIDVFLGTRPCTEDEEADEEMKPICDFFGVLPVVRTFETVLVTATIMPGSSGSAVYNGSKELGAVIFAGSGNIGYGFAVPYEFVANFFREELSKIPPKYPKYTLNVKSLLKKKNARSGILKGVERRCLNDVETVEDEATRIRLEHICDIVIRDLKWRNQL